MKGFLAFLFCTLLCIEHFDCSHRKSTEQTEKYDRQRKHSRTKSYSQDSNRSRSRDRDYSRSRSQSYSDYSDYSYSDHYSDDRSRSDSYSDYSYSGKDDPLSQTSLHSITTLTITKDKKTNSITVKLNPNEISNKLISHHHIVAFGEMHFLDEKCEKTRNAFVTHITPCTACQNNKIKSFINVPLRNDDFGIITNPKNKKYTNIVNNIVLNTCTQRNCTYSAYGKKDQSTIHLDFKLTGKDIDSIIVYNNNAIIMYPKNEYRNEMYLHVIINKDDYTVVTAYPIIWPQSP